MSETVVSAELERLRKRLAEEESAHETTMRQRDFAERWADKLASGVGDVEVIGEHSNLNNPWETAYGLMRSLAEFEAERAKAEKLQRFKDWVHNYLDKRGVPHHPPGVHGAEGCRIGDRMDWLMAKVAGLEVENARLQSLASYQMATEWRDKYQNLLVALSCIVKDAKATPPPAKNAEPST